MLVVTVASSSDPPVPRDLFSCDVGTRCWTIVLLTANLYVGVVVPLGVDSETRALRMEFCAGGCGQPPVLRGKRFGVQGAKRDLTMMVEFHCSVLECS